MTRPDSSIARGSLMTHTSTGADAAGAVTAGMRAAATVKAAVVNGVIPAAAVSVARAAANRTGTVCQSDRSATRGWWTSTPTASVLVGVRAGGSLIAPGDGREVGAAPVRLAAARTASATAGATRGSN